MQPTIDEVIEDFELFDNWEDRYAYLIDLGRKLPAFPESEKTDENKVQGCMSQVWMVGELTSTQPVRLVLQADSDAFIVRGLIALLLVIYSGKTPEQVRTTVIEDVFRKLELERHLSTNRRNGFFAMVQRIKALAGT